jgi:hypothetical protein
MFAHSINKGESGTIPGALKGMSRNTCRAVRRVLYDLPRLGRDPPRPREGGGDTAAMISGEERVNTR